MAYLGFPKEEGRESLFNNVCCSMIAGAVSSAVATPFDVLKVNFLILLSCLEIFILKLKLQTKLKY